MRTKSKEEKGQQREQKINKMMEEERGGKQINVKKRYKEEDKKTR